MINGRSKDHYSEFWKKMLNMNRLPNIRVVGDKTIKLFKTCLFKKSAAC